MAILTKKKSMSKSKTSYSSRKKFNKSRKMRAGASPERKSMKFFKTSIQPNTQNNNNLITIKWNTPTPTTPKKFGKIVSFFKPQQQKKYNEDIKEMMSIINQGDGAIDNYYLKKPHFSVLKNTPYVIRSPYKLIKGKRTPENLKKAAKTELSQYSPTQLKKNYEQNLELIHNPKNYVMSPAELKQREQREHSMWEQKERGT